MSPSLDRPDGLTPKTTSGSSKTPTPSPRVLSDAELIAITDEYDSLALLESPADFAQILSRRDAEPWQPYAHLKLLNDRLMDIVEGRINRLIVTMPPRHGKLIADSTPVPTPDGWVKHGDLRPGDWVFGLDGQPVEIVAVSVPDVADMRVTFFDGSEILCHENHEWTVYDRSRARWRTLETKELASRSEGSRATFQLPQIRPLAYSEKELPLDPYVLGAWLGDGTSDKPAFTHHLDDDAIMLRVEEAGFVRRKQFVHNATGVITSSFAAERNGPHAAPLTAALRFAGVWKNKHIPEIYQRASVEQRLELLAGLIDTDGSVCKATARTRFITTSIPLRDGVNELAKSLGFRTSITFQLATQSSSGIRGTKTVWTVAFQPTIPLPVCLERKRTHRLATKRRVGIKSIVRLDHGEEGRCIQVAASDGLYLVGAGLIPTHNSWLCSYYFPAWFLNKNPDKRIILCSYGDDFASEWGRKVRDLIRDNEARLQIRINDASKAADRWDIAGHRGGMKTAGVGGQITGRGAHLFIIDDPVKDAAEANSATIREQKWDWWRTTARTRLEPGGAVVLIQTRWHEDDLTGRILRDDDEANQWEVINLPALAEEDDLLGRTPGTALCPERYNENALHATRADIGNSAFSALYQQRPQPEGGGAFKRDDFRYYTTPPSEEKMYALQDPDGTLLVPTAQCWRFITMDLALTTRTTSDYTVAAVWDVAPYLDPSRLILVHVDRQRIEGAEHLDMVKRLWDTWKPAFIGIEDAMQGSMTLAYSQRQGIIVRPLKHKSRDKAFRAKDAELLVENHRVYFPKRASWLPDFEHELLLFPTGTHDDQVDVFSYAAQQILKRINFSKPVETFETPTIEERCLAQARGTNKVYEHPVLGAIF